MLNLKTAAARLKNTTVRGKPYFVPTDEPGINLGYRRLADRAGTWTARIADGKGGARLQAIGVADDREPADGVNVLDYAQAAALARGINRKVVAAGLTVADALAAYELADKDRDPRNVGRVRFHLTAQLAARQVAELTADELKAWRNGIQAQAVTTNRTIRILKAALNLAVENFPNLNTNAWQIGLKQIPHKHEANNVILTDDQVRALVAAAYQVDACFGLYLEVAAVTGARPCQIVRLQVRDLQADLGRLQMPTSDKGNRGNTNKATHVAVPVTKGLLAKLVVAAAGRGEQEPLLLRTKGDAWDAGNQDYRLPFARAAELAGIDATVTSYALRHTSIVRQIRAGTPLAIVAKIHDTGIVMIERNYAREITQHDDTARAGLIELDVVTRNNVVALAR